MKVKEQTKFTAFGGCREKERRKRREEEEGGCMEYFTGLTGGVHQQVKVNEPSIN